MVRAYSAHETSRDLRPTRGARSEHALHVEGAARADQRRRRAGYRRREPENGVLHRILRQHLDSFLALVASDATRSLPRFVEQELRAFLDCGVLQKGFARVSCENCRREIFVAHRCKGRGFCPSCGGRRMASTAAHLVDSVLPEVPVRQWVLSLPHDIRFALGYDPQLLSKVRRCFLRKLMSFLRRHAREERVRVGHPGAVCFVQRFDSALLIYGFKRTWKDGSRAIKLTPTAFLERLAALVPRPHRPLVTYHGVLAPNAALRPVIVKLPEPPENLEAHEAAKEERMPTSRGKKHRRKTIQKILQHCGLPHDEPVLAPARSPPGFEDEYFA